MKKYLYLALLCICVQSASGQSPAVVAGNVHYIDSLRVGIEDSACGGVWTYKIPYGKPYDSSDVLEAEDVIGMLNELTADGLTKRKVDEILNRINWVNLSEDIVREGLLQFVTVSMGGKLLHVRVELAYMDSLLITTDLGIRIYNKVNCHGLADEFVDYRFVLAHYVPKISYPMRVIDRFSTSPYMVYRKFHPENLEIEAKAHPGYTMSAACLADSATSWIAQIIRRSYDPDSSCCYLFDRGQPDMLHLISAGRLDMVKDLLWSPSYFYSISAMEALIYLTHVGKIEIDGRMQSRIDDLKRMNYRLMATATGSDVTHMEDGYKDLKMKESAVIKKYQNSLQ
jgi:hypothetical protein